MSFKRIGLGYVDKEAQRAEQDRETVSAVQDLQGVEVEVRTPSTANKEFEIVHNSRTHIPRAVLVLRSSKGSVVYASRIADWDKRRIFVKATVADDPLLVWVR